MIASVGSTIRGASRSSTRTSPGPCITAPRIWFSSGSQSVSVLDGRSSGDRLRGAVGTPQRRRGSSLRTVDRRREVREFLKSRRAKITPEHVGLHVIDGDLRRVPGLRREEVAELAGVSVDYYTQLERGDVDGASDSVLNAVARALRLDDAERTHLFDLARPDSATRLAPSAGVIRPSVQPPLAPFPGGRALARNRRGTTWRPTRWAARCTRRSSTAGSARRTTSDTCSSTTVPGTSSRTGRP